MDLVEKLSVASMSLPRIEPVAYSGEMTGTPKDRELMQRYRNGDLAAFEALYRRHKDSLYRYLLRLCLDRSTAEDLHQEVWAKIVRARRNYQPTAKFATFLYRVAHNCFIDHVRRNRRRAGDLSADMDLLPAESDGDGTRRSAELALLRERMGRALCRLPTEQRDAFLLYEEAGLGLEEIASVTGVNRETAKSRLRYANRKLKAALAEPDRDGPARPQAIEDSS